VQREAVERKAIADREREHFTLTPQTPEHVAAPSQQEGLFTPTGQPAAATKNLPAERQQLYVQVGGQRYAVDSLQDAANKWDEFRQKSGIGGSETPRVLIVDQNGKEVGRISYNGKVWPPGEWHAGMKPLVGENFKPSAAAVQKPAASTEREQPATTERPYRDTSLKELQKIYHETDDQEQLHAVEDEINLRAEEKAKNREDRLAKGRQAKRTKEQVLADLYALTAKWEERRANAKDESIKMLRPTPSDWSTTEELNRYTDLQAELVPFSRQDREDAKKRVEEKRSARRAAMETPGLKETTDAAEEAARKLGLIKQQQSRYAAPLWYSDLARAVSGIKQDSMPAPQWKVYIAGRPGVKQDEIQWTGINDWLDLQQGKVTKQQILGYLDQNGVKVEETELGSSEDQAKATDTFDRLNVELDSLGYSLQMAPDVHTGEDVIDGVRSRQTNEMYAFEQGEGFYNSQDIPLPPRVQAIGRELAALEDRLPTDETGGTQYSSYTLPGGKNYRELLLTLPDKKAEAQAAYSKRFQEIKAKHNVEEGPRLVQAWTAAESAELNELAKAADQGEQFKSGHFDQPNILAHVRFNERTDAEGKKVLFIEEIQSDWAQKGKREGFKQQVRSVGDKASYTMREDEHQYHVTDPTGGRTVSIGKGTVGNEQEARDYAGRYFASQAKDEGGSEYAKPPAAPFVGKTEAWVALALKRMIRYAAENGFDRVAWTTGEQQAERYDLSKHVSLMSTMKQPQQGGYLVYLQGADGYPLFRNRDGWSENGQKTMTAKEIEDTLGKDVAKKATEGADAIAGRVTSDPSKHWFDLREKDLKVGGEGMRAFYDKIVPNVANDVLKKVGGGRVGAARMATSEGEKLGAIGSSGKVFWVDDREGKKVSPDFDSYTAADDWREERQDGIQPQPGFDITPAMRDKAMQGMALFQPKSEYNPEQADHIYDNAQTRPGTTGEQRQLGIAAIKALFGGDRRAGSTILGSALWRDFQEHKGVELVGQRAKSSKDLATLAQILRDPRFETFRIFFTAGDKIVGHSGMTSRLPGQVAVFVPNRGENINEAMERRIEEFQKMKDAFGADGYWILHNHPSGSSHPSSADETITTLFAESMVGFKGHVVIDHDEFSTINAEGDSRTHDIKSGARSEPEVVHELLGRSISSTEQFSDLGKQIQAKSGYDVMISTDHQGKVSGIAEVPTQLLLQGGRSIIRARRFARGTGGDRVFVVSQNPSRLERLVASGAVTDATDYAGHKSLQTLGIGMASGERTTGYKAKVLPAEQKKSEYDQTQTEAFKRWFGDSKVVDADGKPLVVYHGSSTQGIDIFDPSKAGDVQTSDWGKGIYFTPSKGQADGYREEAAVRSDKEDERLWGEYEAAAKRLGTTPMMAGIDLGHGSDAYNSLNEYEKRWRDNRTAVRKRSDLGHVYSAYLRLEKPLDYTYEGMTDPFLSERAKAQGHDGIIIRHDDGSIDEIVVFRPEQIKSATGNRGTFNPESKSIIEQPRSPYIGGSNTTGDARDTYVRDASDWVRNLLHSDARVGWWAKSVGTQQHKALTLPAFKPVYDEGQAFLSDVSKYANGSADLAQDLLPRIEGFRDFLKKNAKPADIASAHDALMAGTLFGGGSPLEGRVWTDKELKSGRATMGNTSLPAFKPLTDAQIKLYREALAATSKSLEELGKSMIHRTVSVHGIGFDRDMSLDDVVASVNEQIKSEVDNRKLDLAALHDRAVEASKDDRAALLKEIDRVQAEIAELEAAKTQVADISEKTTKLKQHGYFPAMRFGKYAVHVVDAEDKQLYFSLFESQTKANIAAAELKKQYPDANIYRAIMSQEQHRLFQGLSLDALETFADYITGADGKPLSKDPIVQGFLKAAVADRSVLKRHIHRKGVAGFSEDMPRVLANFTTAAARHTAMSYHGAEMARLANDIKAGDVKDEAIKLVRYLQDPMEEAQGIRAFLFAQYLGGSLANGLVNMTQPFMVTGPYLTQTTSASDAAIQLMKAAAVNPQKLTGAERNAYDKAHREGVVSPQEIHQLRAQTGGLPLAKNLALRKLSYLWGSIYALTEQFNRTTTFVAAYRIAE
jgi:hypothetical protein